jgi:hypothetical protein
MNKETLKSYPHIDSLVLDSIKENVEFKSFLIKKIPSLESDIVSASLNENCSCRQKIVDYLWSNLDNFVDILIDAFNKGILSLDISSLNDRYKKENISGKVAKTTIKEWPSFVQNLKSSKFEYSNFYLTKEGDDVFVFFI